MRTPKVPTYDALMNPLLEALRALGGSGTIDEINSKTVELMELTDEQLSVLQDPENGTVPKVEYRLAWARTYLKKYGFLENSTRGVWALTPEGSKGGEVNPTKVKRHARSLSKKKSSTSSKAIDNAEEEIEISWRNELLASLLSMSPDAFERLAQRLLRESGFIQVEVTGQSNDGGVDGKGIMRLGGLLSFHVIFQCKRYQGSVGSSIIRDFRGAMVGRADKGLMITTGNFTKEAVKEATRDGAPAIDLIDGDLLMDRLKELSIGVKTKYVQVEQVEIDTDWFASI